MIFRQLFEPESSTYTYLFADPQTRHAVLLDPVAETVERDLAVLHDLELTLACTLDTHIHADHITSACRLRSLTGCQVAYPAIDNLPCADIGVAEGQPLRVGSLTFQPLFTPGHTDAHHSYLVEVPGVLRVFTGDALLIDGCGRTDFQNGDAPTLYRSVTEKIFALPAETLVFPAHDYNHRHVSSVAQERERNPRLGSGRTLEGFVEVMANLNLPYPKKMDLAVPANRLCGDCGEETERAVRGVDCKSYQGAPISRP
jgi:glyoxylase-like metal-dependent hydrolase (beta-lactamase superfamily II)